MENRWGSCGGGAVAGYGPPAGSCPSVILTLSGFQKLICRLCTCSQTVSSFNLCMTMKPVKGMWHTEMSDQMTQSTNKDFPK